MTTERPDPSEYQGKFRDNTLPAKAQTDRLSANEQLRLLYQTGQTEDVTQPPSRRAWQGLKSKKSVVDL